MLPQSQVNAGGRCAGVASWVLAAGTQTDMQTNRDTLISVSTGCVALDGPLPSLGIGFLICKMKGSSTLRVHRGAFQTSRCLMLTRSSSAGPT